MNQDLDSSVTKVLLPQIKGENEKYTILISQIIIITSMIIIIANIYHVLPQANDQLEEWDSHGLFRLIILGRSVIRK